VAFHGFPRFTGDIDFFVRRTPENARRILDVLVTFGFADPALDLATLTARDQVIQLGRPPNRIDILTSISGVAFEDAWRHRTEGDLDGLTVHFIGFDDLRANKTASGRTKDRLDVEQLDRRQRRSSS
jgi:hypothetical protein